MTSIEKLPRYLERSKDYKESQTNISYIKFKIAATEDAQKNNYLF